MPLRDHLRELRNRVLLAVAGLILGAVAGWVLYPFLFDQLQNPILEIAAERERTVQLNFPGVATPLDVRLKVSLFAGVLLSSPWWIYQLWAFITPGLSRRERWYTLGFVAAAVPLFLGGAVLAWTVMPMAVAVLSDLTPDGVSNLMDSREYLSFVMRLVLAFGLAFLLPVIMVGLNLVGMVRGRTWWGGWRWAVMLSFIFAAMATPSADVISLFALAVPICALYFLAVGLCLLHDRRRDRRERERDAEELAGLSTTSGEAPERPARAPEPESDA